MANSIVKKRRKSTFSKIKYIILIALAIILTFGAITFIAEKGFFSNGDEILLESFFDGENFVFRNIPFLSSFEDVLLSEKLKESDVEISDVGRAVRITPVYFAEIGEKCKIVYVFKENTLEDFIGGEYVILCNSQNEFLHLKEKLYTMLLKLPKPFLGKTEDISEKDEFSVTWEDYSKNRLNVYSVATLGAVEDNAVVISVRASKNMVNK